MKKLVSLILALLLALSFASVAAAEGGEKINLVYWYAGNGMQRDTLLVNDRINELLAQIPGMENVTVTLMPTLGNEYQQKLLLAISAGDAKAIKAPGVGPKTAQRIVLELKDKVGGVAGAAGVETASIPLSAMGESSALSEASSALVALGYSPSEAAAALSGLEDGLPVEELVKAGLKRLMRG